MRADTGICVQVTVAYCAMEYFVPNFEGWFCVSLQAFLLKTILFNRESSNWRHISGRLSRKTFQPLFLQFFHIGVWLWIMHGLCLCLLEEEQKTALCSTLSEILESACSSPSTGFCLVTWAKGQSPHTSTHTNTQTQTQSQSQTQDMPEPESSQPPQEQQPSESYVCHIPLQDVHSY